MKNKIFTYLLFVFLINNLFAQNKQLLYDFDQIPQTLLLNPGAEVDYDKHIGVPFLSNIFFQAGATNDHMTYNNILAGTDGFNEVLSKVYSYNLKDSDYFSANQQFEVLNFGFRLKNPDYYLSFGMYEEIDIYANYPKEIAVLFFEGDDKNSDGIPEFNVKTNFDKLNLTTDMVGVFHVGMSKKFGDRLNLGARLKLISGATNINSVKNGGNYFLDKNNGRFEHNFNDMQVGINTSGLINPDGTRLTYGFSDYLKGLFFLNGNVGVGVDLGFTYHVSDNIVITGSLLDLDYVSYTNEVITYNINDFKMEDDWFFEPSKGGEISYWNNTFDNGDFVDLNKIPIDTLQTGYNTYHSPKLNLSGKYKIIRTKGGSDYVFRNVRSTAYSGNEYLISEVGLQTYTAFRPNKVVWAVTAFYTHQFNKYISSKVTYTYDKLSYKNIGFGISTHYKNFNFYATADNLLNLYTIKDSNYQTFQIGMNFIFE
ncbi:MAG: DUF5723 family protein [Bacteroidota bacterium]